MNAQGGKAKTRKLAQEAICSTMTEHDARDELYLCDPEGLNCNLTWLLAQSQGGTNTRRGPKRRQKPNLS